MNENLKIITQTAQRKIKSKRINSAIRVLDPTNKSSVILCLETIYISKE